MRETICRVVVTLGFVAVATGASPARATETENQNISVLPAPGRVNVDGRCGDWDLSGGVFTCSDVENLRGKMAVWTHVMYDAKNLYVLARWSDETPLSNPGSIAGSHGWNGDCLQLRIIARPNENPKPICWVTAWRDRDGKDVIDLDFPKKTHERLKDAKVKGAQQAFRENDDGKGYVQEMALPWTLLYKGGITPRPGERIKFSVEPNFNTGSNFRISMKGIFAPGQTPDRVFTFSSDRSWGYGIFEKKGGMTPQKLRLADRREFDVAMKDGAPAIDWSGLYEEKKMEGFAAIDLDMPEDGFVSLNIKNADGQVVRQLLAARFMTRGRHRVMWDGLTNMSHLKPGEVVAAGRYTWEAIYHGGLGLRLVGWADNGGKAPFDSPGGNWGGDHGMPSAVTTDGQRMYLGWNGSEAGKAVVCTDLAGAVKWRHKYGGFGGASHIAVGKGIVYVYDGHDKMIYRLGSKKGDYSYWQSKDSAVLPVGPDVRGVTYADGRLYVSQGDRVRVLNAATGEEESAVDVAGAGDIEASRDGTVYVLSAGKEVLRLERGGKTRRVVSRLENARGLAISDDGAIYVGVLDPENQVRVYTSRGRLQRSIGAYGGRPLLGPWDAHGMRFITALCIDAKGTLWVAEKDDKPKRFSCWKTSDGTFVREFFGPTPYGATGGAISPADPLEMVGSGCAWKLDATTGRAKCTGCFHRGGMSNSRFGRGRAGRVYVAVAEGWIHGFNPVSIYERIDEGWYVLRARIEPLSDRTEKGRALGHVTGARVWSDENDDQTRQDDEVREHRLAMGGWITGWYMPMTSDMTFYGSTYRVAVTGWTRCGAPLYDLAKARKLPAPADVGRRGGMGSQRGCGTADGSLVLYNGHYGKSHSDFVCYDIASGAKKWSYPNNYVGVHGGHNAPPPQVGMIRGAYDVVGTGKLPDPIGNIFVIGTDKGEWHMLTGDGFYLSSLFEANPLKIKWPDAATPGAILDTCPPGMGAEDFGGSITVTDGGELHLQAGKTAYINIRVVGLDTVRRLAGGRLVVGQPDLAKARGFREKLLQQSVGTRRYALKRKAVTFTGDVRRDFAVDRLLAFGQNASGRIEVAMAYDDRNLYLGWRVKDDTPWVNGASDPAQMYAMGDTVDFQIGTDAGADPKRGRAVLGDLRLSIGNCKGKATAVVYRRVARDKHPRTFYSGVVRNGYKMESVRVLGDARIDVKVDKRGKRYVVEAAVPLASIGLRIADGLKVRGDIGATYGDPAGGDTILRTYWNNQKTGIVADEVYELQMQPGNWGVLTF